MNTVSLTEKAVTEVKKIMTEQGMSYDKVYFRVAMRGGGCSGMTWKLDLDEVYDEKKDVLEEQDGIKIVIDSRSALYVTGTTVDFYDDGLMKRGFVCTSPAVKHTCGCGSSVSF